MVPAGGLAQDGGCPPAEGPRAGPQCRSRAVLTLAPGRLLFQCGSSFPFGGLGSSGGGAAAPTDGGLAAGITGREWPAVPPASEPPRETRSRWLGPGGGSWLLREVSLWL